jgi:hypothetical protein
MKKKVNKKAASESARVAPLATTCSLHSVLQHETMLGVLLCPDDSLKKPLKKAEATAAT